MVAIILCLISMYLSLPFRYKFHSSEQKKIDVSRLISDKSLVNARVKSDYCSSNPDTLFKLSSNISVKFKEEASLTRRIRVYWKDYFITSVWENQPDGVYLNIISYKATKYPELENMTEYKFPDLSCKKSYFFDETIFILCYTQSSTNSKVDFSLKVLRCAIESECRVFPLDFEVQAVFSRLNSGFEDHLSQLSLLKLPGNSLILFQYHSYETIHLNKSVKAVKCHFNFESSTFEADKGDQFLDIPLIIYKIILVNERIFIIVSEGCFYLADRLNFLEDIYQGDFNAPTFVTKNEEFISFRFDEKNHNLIIFSRNSASQIWRSTFSIEFFIEKKISTLILSDAKDTFYYLEIKDIIITFLVRNEHYYLCLKIQDQLHESLCHSYIPFKLTNLKLDNFERDFQETTIQSNPLGSVMFLIHPGFEFEISFVQPYHTIEIFCKGPALIELIFESERQIVIEIEVNEENNPVWDNLDHATDSQTIAVNGFSVLKHISGNLILYPQGAEIRICERKHFKLSKRFSRTFSSFLVENPTTEFKHLYVFEEDQYRLFEFSSDYSLTGNRTFPSSRPLQVKTTNFQNTLAFISEDSIEFKFISKTSDFSSTTNFISAKCDLVHTVSFLDKYLLVLCFHNTAFEYYINKLDQDGFLGPFNPNFEGFTLNDQSKIIEIESLQNEYTTLIISVRRIPDDYFIYIIRLKFINDDFIQFQVVNSYPVTSLLLINKKLEGLKPYQVKLLNKKLVVLALDWKSNIILINLEFNSHMKIEILYFFNLNRLITSKASRISLFSSSKFKNREGKLQGVVYFTFFLNNVRHLTAFLPDRPMYDSMPFAIEFKWETYRNFTFVPVFSSHASIYHTLVFAIYTNDEHITFEFMKIYERPIYMQDENPYSSGEFTLYGLSNRQQYLFKAESSFELRSINNYVNIQAFSDFQGRNVSSSVIIFTNQFPYNIYDIEVSPEYFIEKYLGHLELMPIFVEESIAQVSLPESFLNWEIEQNKNQKFLFDGNFLIQIDEVLNVLKVSITNSFFLLDPILLMEINQELTETKIHVDPITLTFYKIFNIRQRIFILENPILNSFNNKPLEYWIEKPRSLKNFKDVNIRYNLLYFSESPIKSTFYQFFEGAQPLMFEINRSSTHMKIFKIDIQKGEEPVNNKDEIKEEANCRGSKRFREQKTYFLIVSFNEGNSRVDIDIIMINKIRREAKLVFSFPITLKIAKINENFRIEAMLFQSGRDQGSKFLRIIAITTNESFFQMINFRLTGICQQLENNEMVVIRDKQWAKVVGDELFSISKLSNPFVNAYMTSIQSVFVNTHFFLFMKTSQESYFVGYSFTTESNEYYIYLYVNTKKVQLLDSIVSIYPNESRESDEHISLMYKTKENKLGIFKVRKEITIRIQNKKIISSYLEIYSSTEFGILTSKLLLESQSHKHSLKSTILQISKLLLMTATYLFVFLLIRRYYD